MELVVCVFPRWVTHILICIILLLLIPPRGQSLQLPVTLCWFQTHQLLSSPPLSEPSHSVAVSFLPVSLLPTCLFSSSISSFLQCFALTITPTFFALVQLEAPSNGTRVVKSPSRVLARSVVAPNQTTRLRVHSQ